MSDGCGLRATCNRQDMTQDSTTPSTNQSYNVILEYLITNQLIKKFFAITDPGKFISEVTEAHKWNYTEQPNPIYTLR